MSIFKKIIPCLEDNFIFFKKLKAENLGIYDLAIGRQKLIGKGSVQDRKSSRKIQVHLEWFGVVRYCSQAAIRTTEFLRDWSSDQNLGSLNKVDLSLRRLRLASHSALGLSLPCFASSNNEDTDLI